MPLTDDERAQRREQDRARIDAAARHLLTTDGWKQWVTVRSRNGLARYSLTNQMLIALQKPDATYIAGFRAFQNLGYAVRKGEKAIRILAPIRPRRNENRSDLEEQPVTRFRSVAVFDVSQTGPRPGHDPVSLQPPCEPVSGDSHAHLLPALGDLANELGYTVTLRDTGTAGGWCDTKAKEIALSSDLPPNGQVRVLVHELAHALGITYTTHTRAQAEVLVDTVTYVVCRGAGLDISTDAIPYIAGWGEDGDLDAITQYATTIDAIAARIETAIRSVTGGVSVRRAA